MNQEQYKHTKEYFIKYINKLLTKKRIIKKGFLKEIKKDLSTKGFINETIKYNFFLKFLQSDCSGPLNLDTFQATFSNSAIF